MISEDCNNTVVYFKLPGNKRSTDEACLRHFTPEVKFDDKCVEISLDLFLRGCISCTDTSIPVRRMLRPKWFLLDEKQKRDYTSLLKGKFEEGVSKDARYVATSLFLNYYARSRPGDQRKAFLMSILSIQQKFLGRRSSEDFTMRSKRTQYR